MTLTTSAPGTTLTLRSFDGEQRTVESGYVWVLRHREQWFAPARNPEGPDSIDEIVAVFWSKEAGKAYVKANYPIDDEMWIEGEPDGGYDLLIMAWDDHQIDYSLDRIPLASC